MYFYAPLLAFAASGFYLYSISGQLRLPSYFYRLVFELSSIHFIYRKIGFSTIQTMIKNLNQSVHEGMKIFPSSFTATSRFSVKIWQDIRTIIAHFRKKMLDVLAFQPGRTVTRYTPVTLLLLFFSIIAFLSDMKLSAPPVIFLAILTATTGCFLTATEEDKK